MGKSKRKAWELKVTNGEERESEHKSGPAGLNELGMQEDRCEGREEV